jgi:hypothetical protein
LGRVCTEERTGVFRGSGPHMHGRFGDRRTNVRDCTPNIRACVCDRENLRCPKRCELNRRASVRTCGFDRRAPVRVCMVNKRA